MIIPGLLEAQPESDLPSGLPTASTTRLANGLRVVLLPSSSGDDLEDWTDVAFGLTLGVRDEAGHPPGTARVAARYFSVSPSARAIAVIAHLGGGTFEFVEEPDRVGIRVRVPTVLLSPVMIEVSKYFRASAVAAPLRYAHDLIRDEASDADDFRTEVEYRIRSELLGAHRYAEPSVDRAGVDRIEHEDLIGFIAENSYSNRMYVIVSNPLPAEALASLAAIGSNIMPSAYSSPEPPVDYEARLEFPSQENGGVVLATSVESVHYQSWFMTLALDRLFGYVLGPDATLEFEPYPGRFLHRIEIAVRVPESSEGVRDRLLAQIEELRYRPPSPSRLQTIKSEALAYLSERETMEWFVAHDLWTALEDGWGALFNMTADDLRSAAEAFSSARRTIAIWRPVLASTGITMESLAAGPIETRSAVLFDDLGDRIEIPEFAPPPAPESESVSVEPLLSGVTLAEGPEHAVFVAGPFDGDLGGRAASGPNGVLWTFPDGLPAAAWEGLVAVRSDRILVMGPSTELPALRERFGNRAGALDSTPSLPAGEIATVDIPSLLILKVWLDARLIEAGGWSSARLDIDATEGSRLLVDANPARARQVRSWIEEIAERGIDQTEFERVRSAAVRYFDRTRRDLQILLWQRDPVGSIPPPSRVSRARFLDMVRYYYGGDR